jgi:hypothetical protein
MRGVAGKGCAPPPLLLLVRSLFVCPLQRPLFIEIGDGKVKGGWGCCGTMMSGGRQCL